MPLPPFVALCAGIFASAFGYAAIMPLLPEVLGPLLRQAGGLAFSWHAGAFAGVYMLALVLFSPLFGAASDRFGAKPILLLGLAGSAVAAALLAFADGLWSAYAGRAAQGVFAAAVMPVAASALADIRNTAERARKMAGLGSASLLGFFAAPALGAAVISSGQVASVSAALYSSAVVSGAALMLTIWVFVPQRRKHREIDIARTRGLPARFLWLNLLAYPGLGAFEVSLPLAARGPLGVDSAQVSLLFVQCSLVMLVVQAGLMWAAPYRAFFDKVLIASVAAYGVGLLWLAGTGSFGTALAAVGLIAAGSGLVLPLIGFLATLEIEGGAGAALGRLTAAGGLGQAAGRSSAARFTATPECGRLPPPLLSSALAHGLRRLRASRERWAARGAAECLRNDEAIDWTAMLDIGTCLDSRRLEELRGPQVHREGGEKRSKGVNLLRADDTGGAAEQPAPSPAHAPWRTVQCADVRMAALSAV